MPYFPRDFDAPERRAKLREWLATLKGPPKLAPLDPEIQRQNERASQLNQQAAYYEQMCDAAFWGGIGNFWGQR